MILVVIIVSGLLIGEAVVLQSHRLREQNTADMVALSYVNGDANISNQVAHRNGSVIVNVREWPATERIAQQVTVQTQNGQSLQFGVATARSVWLHQPNDRDRLEFCCD